MASVVNVRKAELKKRPEGYSSFEAWAADPNHVYIGRNMTFYVPGTTASKWKNPFSAKKYPLEDCLALYEKHVRETPELWNSLEELRGKELGCWCYPAPCHGNVLIRLLEEKDASL